MPPRAYVSGKMPPDRARRTAGLLVCLLAAFATAAAAHVVLGAFGDDYAEREHLALGPVALAAAALLAAGLLRVAFATLARVEHADPLVVLARGARTLDPRLPLAAVFAGGLGTLVAMESVEQLAARGPIDVAGALGGNVLVGLAVVLAVAALAVMLGLRLARLLVAATIVTARRVAALLRRRAGATIACAPAAGRRRPVAVAVAFLARCSGLRAPPFPATIR